MTSADTAATRETRVRIFSLFECNDGTLNIGGDIENLNVRRISLEFFTESPRSRMAVPEPVMTARPVSYGDEKVCAGEPVVAGGRDVQTAANG